VISTKKAVQYLHKFCKDLEIQSWVFSPGSRNAPLTLTFCNDDYFDCTSVVDERSAAFIALGKALVQKSYVGISCTSGSAVLNYAPAIAEAFYQKVPMLIVTSDRPQKWIGNGEGQSINQIGVFHNYIVSSYHINESDSEENILETFENLAVDINNGISGPIHLNLAFDEPLYNSVSENPVTVEFKFESESFSEEYNFVEIGKQWNQYEKIMVLCGQNSKDEKLDLQLKLINEDPRVVVLTESLSNLSDFKFVNCIDRTLAKVGEEVDSKPQLVLTVGEAIVSKKIKKYLRDIQGLQHWHVSENGESTDVFEKLQNVIISPLDSFFRNLVRVIDFESTSLFKSKWLQNSFLAEEKHDQFVSDVQWSDLKVFKILHDLIPDNITLHVGNSSPIRYVQLFNAISSIEVMGNRGVSGIDGCTSTALGYASEIEKINLLIVGDLSFIYDINAFWNNIEKNNLKVVVINNGGGGIFRIIPGPDSTNQLASRFEVGSNAKIQNLCEAYGMVYFQAANEIQLESSFIQLLNSKTLGVLEVVTPNEINADVLKSYFEYISRG
jgi:2-succinyl-5-enolpyruvyl-6-hydroxy-3-cyclohexene-1-carboxylate synthase